MPVAALVVACAVTYGLTVGVTDAANGLDAVPLAELGSGAHDPKDLPFPASGAVALLGWLALALTPLVAGVGALFVGVDVVHSLRAGRGHRDVLPAVAVTALCVVVLAACLGLAPLTAWWMD